ncbi:hypothetical protein MHM84_19070 [Halomonas sp. McH1-25]|uniref:NADH-quinone oxidoreductase subunit D-related protein n=1 Tax=unclassified Halomonas TaxID=2609666 RepID=UPI001EF49B04|nr:hypothetical protein [Halomonas sp. McH1-25]MCP1343535.1 hypothetical protein [Halomonas sp. FL8]MCP1361651.1 hypothetical protein [Halomonas sp. BBD45]MCP1363659.1 hypothetical protein [Halomonas sp. BBD48]
MSWLRKLASRTRVPVFPVLGKQGDRALRYLALSPEIELVDSPRHASVLLIAGEIPADRFEPLRRVHDQLPYPFTTLWFRSEPWPHLENVPSVEKLDELPGALITAHRELMAGQRDSAPRILTDKPPNPWEGEGDFGQGGEGMMGGVPYGRPMAMNMQDDIRDGLTLDSLTFRLGPFFTAFPPGMVAEITLQGDLVQTWNTQLAPYPQSLDPVFIIARERPVPIAELELARARHHLHRLFHALHLAGLESASLEVLRLAQNLSTSSSLGGLRRHLVRVGFFSLSSMEGGVLNHEQARKIGGPAARAAGLANDLRSHDTGYRRLGFSPVCQTEGNTYARWWQVLEEIDQSLHLARLAECDDVHTSEVNHIETPRGPWSEQGPEDASSLLDEVLPDLEWGEALATVASLDVAAVVDEGGGTQTPDELRVVQGGSGNVFK